MLCSFIARNLSSRNAFHIRSSASDSGGAVSGGGGKEGGGGGGGGGGRRGGRRQCRVGGRGVPGGRVKDGGLAGRHCRRYPPPREHERPGTNPGTGTAYHPMALPTVGPYALAVPGVVPGLPDCAQSGNTARQGDQPPVARGRFQNLSNTQCS